MNSGEVFMFVYRYWFCFFYDGLGPYTVAAIASTAYVIITMIQTLIRDKIL